MNRARSSWIIVLFAAIAGTSLAGENTARVVVPTGRPDTAHVAGLSLVCRQFLAVPADTTSELLPWMQQLSLAACRQSIVVAPVGELAQLRPMITRLDQFMAPSVAIYRDAIARGPARIQILAAYGLGMTSVSVIVRARTALRVLDDEPGYGGATYGGMPQSERSRQLHQALETMLVTQRDAAASAFAQVAQLARSHPTAATADQVVRWVVASAQRQAGLLR